MSEMMMWLLLFVRGVKIEVDLGEVGELGGLQGLENVDGDGLQIGGGEVLLDELEHVVREQRVGEERAVLLVDFEQGAEMLVVGTEVDLHVQREAVPAQQTVEVVQQVQQTDQLLAVGPGRQAPLLRQPLHAHVLRLPLRSHSPVSRRPPWRQRAVAHQHALATWVLVAALELSLLGLARPQPLVRVDLAQPHQLQSARPVHAPRQAQLHPHRVLSLPVLRCILPFSVSQSFWLLATVRIRHRLHLLARLLFILILFCLLIHLYNILQ